MKVGVDILTEFLEVAFHCILYVRDIYPSAVFERRKKYGLPIYICVHTEVRQYIIDLLKSIKDLIDKSQTNKISFVILDKEETTIERFVFEIAVQCSDQEKDANYMSQLEHTLRSFLLKLNICDSELEKKPQGRTWTVQVHTKESAVIDMQEQQNIGDFMWEETEEKKVEMPNPKFIPIKTMDSDIIKMQLFAEEVQIKSEEEL